MGELHAGQSRTHDSRLTVSAVLELFGLCGLEEVEEALSVDHGEAQSSLVALGAAVRALKETHGHNWKEGSLADWADARPRATPRLGGELGTQSSV